MGGEDLTEQRYRRIICESDRKRYGKQSYILVYIFGPQSLKLGQFNKFFWLVEYNPNGFTITHARIRIISDGTITSHTPSQQVIERNIEITFNIGPFAGVKYRPSEYLIRTESETAHYIDYSIRDRDRNLIIRGEVTIFYEKIPDACLEITAYCDFVRGKWPRRKLFFDRVDCRFPSR